MGFFGRPEQGKHADLLSVSLTTWFVPFGADSGHGLDLLSYPPLPAQPCLKPGSSPVIFFRKRNLILKSS